MLTDEGEQEVELEVVQGEWVRHVRIPSLTAQAGGVVPADEGLVAREPPTEPGLVGAPDGGAVHSGLAPTEVRDSEGEPPEAVMTTPKNH